MTTVGDATTGKSSAWQLSRRRLLQMAAGTSIAAVLSSCQQTAPVQVDSTEIRTDGTSPTTTPEPTMVPKRETHLAAPTIETTRPLPPSEGTHVIFDLCIRDGSCVEVCPVECIVPGQPPDEWPWYYVDPDVCIECGACVPECPVEAILPAADLPEKSWPAIEMNAMFFIDGPGYAALDM